MKTTTLDIYNLLIEAGIDADKAEPLAKEILTRSEAKETLATKADIAQVQQSISRTGYTVIGIVLAGMAVLLQLFS